MAAVNAAIIVQFVDDDVAEIFEEFGPAGVVRQDAGMQHVGVGQHQIRTLPDGLARVLRGVAIVSKGANIRSHFLDNRVGFVELILGKGLGGKQVHGARAGVFEEEIEYRQVVAPGLPAGGGRHDGGVAAGLHQLESFGLVAVQGPDAALFEGRAQRGPDRGGNVAIFARRGGLVPDAADGRIGNFHQRLKARQRRLQFAARSQFSREFREAERQVHLRLFFATVAKKKARCKQSSCAPEELVAFERGRNTEHRGLTVVGPFIAQHLADAAQVHGQAVVALKRDDVLNGLAEFRLALGKEKYSSRADVTGQA